MVTRGYDFKMCHAHPGVESLKWLHGGMILKSVMRTPGWNFKMPMYTLGCSFSQTLPKHAQVQEDVRRSGRDDRHRLQVWHVFFSGGWHVFQALPKTCTT